MVTATAITTTTTASAAATGTSRGRSATAAPTGSTSARKNRRKETWRKMQDLQSITYIFESTLWINIEHLRTFLTVISTKQRKLNIYEYILFFEGCYSKKDWIGTLWFQCFVPMINHLGRRYTTLHQNKSLFRKCYKTFKLCFSPCNFINFIFSIYYIFVLRTVQYTVNHPLWR